MSRLIDADAFKKVIKDKLPLGLFMKRTIPSAMKAMGELVEEVDQAPTIDQWHYPSRGEFPKIGEIVFCKDCLGEYNVVEYQGNSVDGEPPWLFNDKIDDYVLAWQYIIPPKEEEDE